MNSTNSNAVTQQSKDVNSNNNGNISNTVKDTARRCAAHRAVDEHLQDCQTIGIGSGRTIVFAVERIAELVKQNKWSVKCIPTSYQAKQLIVDHGLTLWQMESCSEQPDWAIDGADEVNRELNLIKGGGGCLMQEKVIDCSAKKFVVVVDQAKRSIEFGDAWHGGIPIEVLPMAALAVQFRLQADFGGKAVIREANGKLGPVVTDNGNFLLDWHFDKQHNWQELDIRLHLIPGLLETGLFINAATAIYVGKFDGSVDKLSPASAAK